MRFIEQVTDLTMAEAAEYRPGMRHGSFGAVSESDASSSSAMQIARLAEAMEMLADMREGRVDPYLISNAVNPRSEFAMQELRKRWPLVFREAMSTNDFTALTSTALNRTLLGTYTSLPNVGQQLCKVSRNIRDFRLVERFAMDGGQAPFQQVGELEGFQRRSIDQSTYSFRVKKYEGGFSFSWESVINDDLGILDDMINRLANGGANTIEDFVANLIADANGPHASFYTNGNANILTTGGGTPNPSLTVDNLIDALGFMMNMVDPSDSNPIAIDMVTLVVGDGRLFNLATNIANTVLWDTNINGGTAAGTTLRVRNWISGKFNVVYMPWLRKVVTSNLSTSWWLFASPAVTRPALELGFLRGFDAPRLFRKLPNTVSVGGGSADEMGDFEIMAQEFKGIQVFGGTRANSKMTAASKGTNA